MKYEDYIARLKNNLVDGQYDKTALFFAGQQISYDEVGERVLRIMAAFENENITSGMVVAVCLRKSPEFIYTVLACTLKGVIWLPVDMDSPSERMTYLLANSCADYVVSQSPIQGQACLDIAALLKTPTSEHSERTDYRLDETPGYYLYTSGSTGAPKCVVLNHRATANVLQQTLKRWNISENDCLMAVTPFHHDMSVFDIFATLSVGATLVIPSQEQQRDARAWGDLVARYGITVWVSVPAIVDMLFTLNDGAKLSSLRLIAQGGDYIKPSLIARIRAALPNTRLFSLGGPTETTIWSIWHEIQDCDTESIPYGTALPGNQYYILDEQRQPCVIGEVGRMYMSGINLSNGYIRDGQVVRSDFLTIPNAQQDLETVFQMSDLGYIRDDDTIIFAGREEGYLKVKGVRIAAVEVENALTRHPNIKDAIVLSCAHPDDDLNELVALYTEEGRAATKADLKAHLMSLLPQSHIPSKWLCLENLPLTVNGKVDRKALARMAQERFFPTSTNQSGVALTVKESVLSVFKEAVEGVQCRALISEQTLLSTLNLRPQQLMSIAKQFADLYKVSVDFYSIAKCRTLQDVMNYLGEQSQAA
ncbi:AMP-binding protein [Marinomonas fungiae]|uniref:AMP-binding protein n=1 Tax=Marinomonas fungiae TaxID=1137284 RepID=UPI003A904B34